MKLYLSKKVFWSLPMAFCLFSAGAQQLAFPGAEGFGRFTTGGRGGSVYHVTNLNDSGPGSFRDAVSQSNRTVVFDVGGVINISSRIVIHSNITIAGQTAPGDGITIYGNGIALNGDSGNDIIRYIRIRMGKNGDSGKDAVAISEGQNYLFDHVSISWGRDGTLDVNGTGIDNLTFQDCIISQGINNTNHSTGGLMQSGKWSIIRSLYIDNKTRNPKARGTHEFINSVLYNWDEHGYIMGDTEGLSECNLIGNYFIFGPSSNSDSHITGTTPSFRVYASDNWVDSDKDGNLDGSPLTNYKTATVVGSPFPYPGVNNLMSAQAALNHIIQHVGASLDRDAVDQLLINQLTSYGTSGQIINTEDDNGIPGNVGTVNGGSAPTDSDQDGMSNSWESANGTNPNVADNNGDLDGDGYTNLEEYLHWVITGTQCSGTPITPYIRVNGGSWQQTSSVTVSPGATVEFGPQPSSGGSWSWSGCGTSGSSRTQSFTASSSCTATATFTNSCGTPTTQNFNITVSGGTGGSVTIQENTTGFCGVDGSVDNNNSGYTGAGFANTNNSSGSGIEWRVNATSGGSHTITFRYANGGGSNRPGNILIDGNTVGSLSFGATSSWTDWVETSINVNMNSGVRAIEVVATGSTGLGNVDWIRVTNATANSCTSAPSTITIEENTSGFCSVNGTVDNNNAGFTGSGFANTDNASGTGINWSVSVPSGGTYSLAWRYANGSSDRPGSVIVNGSTQIGNVSLAGTGSWTTWNTTSGHNVTLSSGTNTIRLQATTSSGLANIDNIQISGTGPSPGNCSGAREGLEVSTGQNDQLRIYPNPVTSQLYLATPEEMTGLKKLSVFNITGQLLQSGEFETTNYQLNAENLQPGTYLIRVQGSGTSLESKFIKY